MSFPLVGNLSFPEGLRTSRNDRKGVNVVLLMQAIDSNFKFTNWGEYEIFY